MGKSLATILAAVIVVNVFYDDFVRVSYKKSVKNNAKKYEQEIDLYNEFLKEYSKYIKSLELSETEMIIKVIKAIIERIIAPIIEAARLAENAVNATIKYTAKKVIPTKIGFLRIFCNTIASNIVTNGNTKNTNKIVISFSPLFFICI